MTMSTQEDTWTRAHDLALVYIALAYGTDYDLHDAELTTITEALKAWEEDARADVKEVVMESLSIFLDGRGSEEASRSMHSLRETLSDEERQRALDDIVRIAEADGVVLQRERSMISSLAALWGLKATFSPESSPRLDGAEEAAGWTVLHDISLMYIILAHSTDGDLSEVEIGAMIERLRDWQPHWSEEQVRSVIRTALEAYADQPEEERLIGSVESLKKELSLIQRLALLDDLVHIAEVDGHLNEHEKQIVLQLARAWGVGVRLNGSMRAHL